MTDDESEAFGRALSQQRRYTLGGVSVVLGVALMIACYFVFPSAGAADKHNDADAKGATLAMGAFGLGVLVNGVRVLIKGEQADRPVEPPQPW